MTASSWILTERALARGKRSQGGESGQAKGDGRRFETAESNGEFLSVRGVGSRWGREASICSLLFKRVHFAPNVMTDSIVSALFQADFGGCFLCFCVVSGKAQ